MNVDLSIVIPIYKCFHSIESLVSRLHKAVKENFSNYEIILVNDASPENDWEEIKKQADLSDKIKGINLSRNFGQHYAITAGLEHATGEWTVVMDGDLQDRPEEIVKLYNKAKKGFDIVYARRHERQDSMYKRMSSHLFYKVLGYLTDTDQNAEIANFGIYNKKVIDTVCSMNDYTRYFPTMVKWVGFKSTSIDVEHAERENGESAYNFKALLKLALDTMIVFSDKPLRLTVKLGFTMSVFSLFFAGLNVIQYFRGNIDVTGWTTLIVSIWFLSGLIIFILGIVGLYLGKVFDQVKGRPSHIIKEII